MDPADIGARLRAARVLAGLDRDELARRVNIGGLGEKTLGAVERGERELKPHEIPPVAGACGLPIEFFTADDFSALAGGAPDLAGEVRQLADDVAALRQSMLEILMMFRRNPPAQVRQRKARAASSGSG